MNASSAYKELALLKQPQIDFLTRRGVSANALIYPECLRMVRGFCAEDGYFDYCEEGKTHFAFLAENRFSDEIDIVFWNPASGELASMYHRVFALGEEQIGDPWSCVHGGHLEIHPSPWEWLINGKQGIVIIREEWAFDKLRDVPNLLVNDAKLGEQLRELLQPRYMPKILVSIEEEAA
jgi:hypothetical protein